MPRRRHQSFLARLVSGAGAVVPALWDPVTRRPVDSIAIAAAVATALIIVVNAIFLQSSMQAPAPSAPRGQKGRETPVATGPH